MKHSKIGFFLLLSGIFLFSAAGCAPANAANIMEGINAAGVSGHQPDAAFIESMADFSVELFKESITENENSLVSPLSVSLALAMTSKRLRTSTTGLIKIPTA